MGRLIIAGDISVNSSQQAKALSRCFDLHTIIEEVDYSIANLETTVCDYNPKAIIKQGPSLIGPMQALNAVREIGFSAVTMANNHIYDYGETALEETLKGLDERGIEHVGAGLTKEDASKTLFVQSADIKIAILNCCEHEFSIATDKHGGANPLDSIQLYYQIKEAQKQSDFVLVIIHGGVEHFQYPTPRMVKLYRFLVDVGADAVINHHQHCPCGYEEYNGKPIFYGLGNFFFPWEGKINSIWNLGYMVKLSLENGHVGYEIIPYRQCDNSLEVSLLKGEDLDSFNEKMRELCSTIKDEEILKKKLHGFNVQNDYLYKKMLEPYSGRLMNALYRRGMLPSFIGKERILSLMDFIGCESHYERVMDYLNDKYNQFFNE